MAKEAWHLELLFIGHLPEGFCCVIWRPFHLEGYGMVGFMHDCWVEGNSTGGQWAYLAVLGVFSVKVSG